MILWVFLRFVLLLLIISAYIYHVYMEINPDEYNQLFSTAAFSSIIILLAMEILGMCCCLRVNPYIELMFALWSLFALLISAFLNTHFFLNDAATRPDIDFDHNIDGKLIQGIASFGLALIFMAELITPFMDRVHVHLAPCVLVTFLVYLVSVLIAALMAHEMNMLMIMMFDILAIVMFATLGMHVLLEREHMTLSNPMVYNGIIPFVISILFLVDLFLTCIYFNDRIAMALAEECEEKEKEKEEGEEENQKRGLARLWDKCKRTCKISKCIKKSEEEGGERERE